LQRQAGGPAAIPAGTLIVDSPSGRIPGPAQRAGRSPTVRPMGRKRPRLTRYNGKPVDPQQYLPAR
ncbi:hypothetical protein, partial [Stenotrophomonas maltophilia]|uniref:hypothetical protein n=3 Tax=Stenotrophomonas maltophilia TaxID=40324 RepID=UPI001969AECA